VALDTHCPAHRVLLSYLVPVSLFVSMEVVSLAQGVLFISRDQHMRDPVTLEPAVARNTDLNEDLGHISHVFSDKTGTLTCNDMRLRALLLDGHLLGTPSFKLETCGLPPAEAMRAFDERLADAVQRDTPAGARQAAVELLTAIAVCHTLIVDAAAPAADGTQSPSPGGAEAQPMFTGPSPDEVALADGARLLGVHFTSRSSRGVTLNILDAGAAVFEQLAVLEFSSERQRMSVVVRRPDGRITLFCKGADAAILPLLTPASQLDARGLDIRRQTEQGLHTLAQLGLRTLVLASRELSGDDWAALAPSGTDTASEEWQALVERDLTLLGGTGVDDQLQEGVRDTVELLLTAGIKVWVLTGDKQETAITICSSCGLLDPSSVLLLNADSPVTAAARMQSLRAACARAAPGAWELVVDGPTLGHILSDGALAATFATLGASARAVCVCRCSPRQKSAVVELMQRHRRQALRAQHSWWHTLVGEPLGRSLAIGDGANDVPMLQAADVGVGIAGKEGRQAVNAADYGIAQFRFLARLLLLHGTLCRYRLTRLIKYSFYKNIAFCCLLFYFQFYAGFSGQALYDSISAGLFNVVLTSAPVVAFALLDRPLSDAGLLAHPQAYNTSHSLSGRTFWKTLLDACAHGAICFFFALYGVPSSGGVKSDALSGLLQVGKVAYTSILVTVTLELCLHARYITLLFAGITLLSVATWWLLLWLVPAIAWVSEFEAMAPLLFSSPSFWLTVALSAGAATAYRLAWLAFVSAVLPSDLDILHEGEVLGTGAAAEVQPSSDAEAGQANGETAVATPVVE
jgi:phospholipid-transporting ATPase